jgi:hypothetical protein
VYRTGFITVRYHHVFYSVWAWEWKLPLFSFLRWAGAFTVGSSLHRNKHGSELEDCKPAFPISVKRRVLVGGALPIGSRILRAIGHFQSRSQVPTFILGLAVQSRFLLTTVPFRQAPYLIRQHGICKISMLLRAWLRKLLSSQSRLKATSSFLPPARLPFPSLT